MYKLNKLRMHPIRHRTVRCTAANRHTLARVPPLTQVGLLIVFLLILDPDLRS